MKQRVAIARAYAVNPEVLLMDEPFGALDAQTRTQLQTELLETSGKEAKKTCFFITHDVEEAIILAQKVIIMSARPGRIKDIVDIDIPYPRTQETKMSDRFLELKNHIWGQVYQEYIWKSESKIIHNFNEGKRYEKNNSSFFGSNDGIIIGSMRQWRWNKGHRNKPVSTESAGGEGTESKDSEAPAEMVEVNVAYMPDYASTNGVISAKELGYFEEEGIKVNLIQFADGPTIINAMESGSVDVGYIGQGAHKLCINGQATIFALAHVSNGDAIIGNKEKGVTTLEDLKGKQIAYSSGTSSEDMLKRKVLKKPALQWTISHRLIWKLQTS